MRSSFCLLILCVLTACGEVPETTPPEDDIPIGLIASVTGSFITSGQPTIEGARLAVAEINRNGGVLVGDSRRRIRLLVEDSEGRPEVALSKAVKLCFSERVSALVGLPLSFNAIPVARLAEDKKVPMISTISTHPETTRRKSYVFRTTFTDTFQGRVLADFAHADLGARRVALLVDAGNTYSLGVAEIFKSAFEEKGGHALLELFTVDDGEDYRAHLARIRDDGAEVIVLPNTPILMPALLDAVIRSGSEAMILGSDSAGAVDFQALGLGMEFFERGYFFSDLWAPDLPGNRSQDFIDAFQQEFGSVPNAIAATAYDTIFMIAAAITGEGAADRKSLRTGLSRLKDFRGVTGTIGYSGNGDPARSAVIRKIGADGIPRFYKQVEPTVESDS